MSLKLSISGLEVEIIKFESPTLPRAVIQSLQPTVDYSINGSSIVDGAAFEKYEWVIAGGLVTPDQTDIIKGIWRKSNHKRFTPPRTGFEILLIDTNEYYVDELPRSRAIAPGCSEIPMGTEDVKYYAQFKCIMTQAPKFEERGRFNSVSFTLQETDIIPA